MKRFYLSKGKLVRDYYLDEGSFSSRRKVVCNEESFLLERLKDVIDKKRKSRLYIAKDNFPLNQINEIKKFFLDSKVIISADSIENIKKLDSKF